MVLNGTQLNFCSGLDRIATKFLKDVKLVTVELLLFSLRLTKEYSGTRLLRPEAERLASRSTNSVLLNLKILNEFKVSWMLKT